MKKITTGKTKNNIFTLTILLEYCILLVQPKHKNTKQHFST